MRGLLISLIAGLSFIIGYIISKLVKQKEKFVIFSISLAFPILLALAFFDLLPEVYMGFKTYDFYLRVLFIIALVLFGIFFLKLLDLYIPHHNHNHQHPDPKDHISHLNHIGLVTAISLFLHNLIEGIAIYTTANNNLKSGLLMMIAVSLHNIPLSIEISSSMSTNKKENIITTILLTISSFPGGLIIYLSNISIPEVILSSLMAITMGMVLYISLFELLPEILNHKKLKETSYGIFAGCIILLIAIFI